MVLIEWISQKERICTKCTGHIPKKTAYFRHSIGGKRTLIEIYCPKCVDRMRNFHFVEVRYRVDKLPVF